MFGMALTMTIIDNAIEVVLAHVCGQKADTSIK